MASAELVWQIVKDNSCFLQKRKVPGRSQMGKMGPHFTTEPNNLAGINSWKYSGLANTKSVGIDAAAGGGVAFVTKTSKAKKIRKVRASRPARRARPPARPPAATQRSLSPSRRCVAAVEAVQQAGAQRRLPSGGPGDQQRGEGQLLPPRPRERCAARQPCLPRNPSPLRSPRRRRRPARPAPCRLGSGRAGGNGGRWRGEGHRPRHPGAEPQRPPRARFRERPAARSRCLLTGLRFPAAPRSRARQVELDLRGAEARRKESSVILRFSRPPCSAAEGGHRSRHAAEGVEPAARRFLVHAPNCIRTGRKGVRRTGPAPGAVAPLL